MLVAVVEGVAAPRLRFTVTAFGEGRKGWSSISGGGERLEEEEVERFPGRSALTGVDVVVVSVTERGWRRLLDLLGESISETMAVSRAMREVRIVLVLGVDGSFVIDILGSRSFACP